MQSLMLRFYHSLQLLEQTQAQKLKQIINRTAPGPLFRVLLAFLMVLQLQQLFLHHQVIGLTLRKLHLAKELKLSGTPQQIAQPQLSMQERVTHDLTKFISLYLTRPEKSPETQVQFQRRTSESLRVEMLSSQQVLLHTGESILLRLPHTYLVVVSQKEQQLLHSSQVHLSQ